MLQDKTRAEDVQKRNEESKQQTQDELDNELDSYMAARKSGTATEEAAAE